MGFNFFKTEYKDRTDEELMQLITLRGNEKAFEALYDRYHQKLQWFSRRITGNKEQAEDIVQDTFIKLIDKPQAFNPAQKFSTWIYTVVNNASLSAIKNESNRARLIDEHYVQTDSTLMKHQYDASLIRQTINTIYGELNEKEKMVFVLRFEQDLSIKEISGIAQLPEGSVKSCLFYLLKKIDKQLKSQQVI